MPALIIMLCILLAWALITVIFWIPQLIVAFRCKPPRPLSEMSVFWKEILWLARSFWAALVFAFAAVIGIITGSEIGNAQNELDKSYAELIYTMFLVLGLTLVFGTSTAVIRCCISLCRIPSNSRVEALSAFLQAHPQISRLKMVRMDSVQKRAEIIGVHISVTLFSYALLGALLIPLEIMILQ